MIPDRLYGRDRELGALLETFERISRGQGQVLLVPGNSGVGKTALLQSLRQPVRAASGFFIQGKFEQYRHGVPYFGFRQALAELCHQLQSGTPEQQERQRSDILQALGDLGQLLVDVVPEFESFLGPQPPLGGIGSREAGHRFGSAFQSFFKVICRPQRPLVLFLDDWQWADPASLRLLEQLRVGIALRHLLVIVSYRDTEVSTGHPLLSTLENLRSQTVPVQELPLQSLSRRDLQALVEDSLQPAADNPGELASVIHGQTGGNPFFARSFLHFLQELHRIWFDSAHNLWRWSLEGVPPEDLPANVVELFALTLGRLDPAQRRLLSLAACLGNRIDVETLSLVSGTRPEECRALLLSGSNQSLVVPLESPNTCKFLHDRVQQAAYSLIEPAQLPGLRLKIGRALIAALSPEQLSEQLFEVLSGLNAGLHLLDDTAEQLRVFELNITAARKAYAATAYRAALQHYRAAHRLLEHAELAELLWRDHHALTMKLLQELAECEFIEGHPAEAEKHLHQAVARARTSLERAEALNGMIIHYTLQAKYPEAIAAGRLALAALGLSLPEEGYEEWRRYEIEQVRQELGNRQISSLIELEAMSHPEMLMASRILITMGPPCYRSHQLLWGVLVPKVVKLTLRYGNIPQVGYSHTAFGGLLVWVDDDFSTAREFGELATHLMTRTFLTPSDQSVFYLMIGSSIRHWFKHLKLSTQDYLDAVEIGLRSSNLQYTAYAYGHNMYCRFYQAAPLQALMSESRQALEFSRTRLNQWAIDLLEGGLHLFGALATGNPVPPDQAAQFEADYLRRVEGHHNIQVQCIYKVLKTFSLLVLGHDEAALLLSDEVEPLIYTVGTQGLLPWPEHVFARMMILTALYGRASRERQARWREELEESLGRLRLWADSCPENFQHKYWLAAAELARIDGQPTRAMSLFDQAVEAAQAGGFLQWQALANERAHRFWLEHGNERLAQVYWQQAYAAYQRWGAAAKVSSLEADYRAYLVDRIPGREEYCHVLLERHMGVIRNYVDITESRQAKQELIESEKRYKSMVENIEDGYFEADLSGNLTFFNDSLARILGYANEDMEGLNFRACMEPESARKAFQVFQDVYQTGTPSKGSGFEIIRRSGTLGNLEVSVSRIDTFGGKPIGFRGVARDVTERKVIETLEQQRMKADEANRAKSRFLATMSHEIRTPLHGILGMTEACLETRLDEEQKYIVGLIHKEADSLLGIINEILDFSKIEVGKLEIEHISFDLRALCEDLMEVFARQASQKGLELTFFLAPETPIQMMGDPVRLGQILRNLIGNAVKFTHQGKIVVEAEPVQDFSDRLKLKFRVRDTGIGISKDKQALIFESFTQADGSMTRLYGGTGLGITISKHLTELMGGEIGVESEEGKGSTFWFTAFFSRINPADSLPPTLGPGSATVDRPVSEEERGRKRLRILLAEDYPTNQVMAQRHLELAGYQVDLAENGQLALEAFANKRYDLILMDIEMPVMSGWQAARAIRELEKERAVPDRVPIVAMTAHALREHKDLCLEAGMDDFLSKPTAKKELLSMIAKWLERSSGPPDPIDLVRALAEFEGDRELLATVIAGFVHKVSEQLAAIREALSAGDAETVRREAHSIKGGAAGLTADLLSKVASRLEARGKSQQLNGAGELVDELERELVTLRGYLLANPPV